MNPIFQELPTKLGIYNLTALLGTYEHSELYLATQSYVDRAVVIEVLRPTSDIAQQRSFRDTARLRAAVNLPRVAPVLESAGAGNILYLVQEEPPGKPLRQLENPLNVDQAFTLIQRIAEVYCACAERGVAARPLTLQDVYMDGESFGFFSPVVADVPHEGFRVAQMEQLAYILEQVLSETERTASNISIIIHWLRNGYGNEPMQWQPLAASLSTLRAAKIRGKGVPLMQRLRALFRSKRRLRVLTRYAWLGLMALGIVGATVGVGQLFEEEVVENRPALCDGYLHCGSPNDGWRVRVQPVSVGEYDRFLKAWSKMSSREREALCRDLPDEEVTADRAPLAWRDQLEAAGERRVRNGVKMTMNSPVCGVSYWDACVYARYAKAEVARADMVCTVRQRSGEPGVEEWTAPYHPAHVPLAAHCVVVPVDSKQPLIMETHPAQRTEERGFRIVMNIKS